MSARVDLLVATVAGALSVILLAVVWLADDPDASLDVFAGSEGFLLTSEPLDAIGPYPYVDLEGRRAAGVGAAVELSTSVHPDFGEIGTIGGSLANTCDVVVFVAHLTADPDRMRRFAIAAEIPADSVGDFFDSLRPSALQGDALFDVHGDDDGVRVREAKRLDAGTAVLVDDAGTPRVRCLSANPLTSSQDAALANAVQPGGDLLQDGTS